MIINRNPHFEGTTFLSRNKLGYEAVLRRLVADVSSVEFTEMMINKYHRCCSVIKECHDWYYLGFASIFI